MTLVLSGVLLGIPFMASAHEVYVLDTATIARDIAALSPNPFVMAIQEPHLFILSGFIGVILVSTVFAMSITHWLESMLNPVLNRLKPFAAPIARATLGICLLASAQHNALFGPELPLSQFGTGEIAVQFALFVSGVFILLGLWTRGAGIIALAVFMCGVLRYHLYMATYLNYLGEILVVIILGSGRFSLDRSFRISKFNFDISLLKLARRLEPYAFPILRVLFGISIAFASYYAKFLHSQLALDVVANYHLSDFFHFDPLFTVLGAFIVEVLIGLFIIFGFEIRHTALFFLFWIFLSLLYFGESVWPHLVLVGVLIALFCHGYDRYSLEGYAFKHHEREPVL